MICEWTSGSLHAIFLITISHGLIWPLYFLFDSSYLPPNDTCMDKRLFTAILAPDERAKHAYYCQRHQDEVTPTVISWWLIYWFIDLLIDWVIYCFIDWLSDWLIYWLIVIGWLIYWLYKSKAQLP